MVRDPSVSPSLTGGKFVFTVMRELEISFSIFIFRKWLDTRHADNGTCLQPFPRISWYLDARRCPMCV